MGTLTENPLLTKCLEKPKLLPDMVGQITEAHKVEWEGGGGTEEPMVGGPWLLIQPQIAVV